MLDSRLLRHAAAAAVATLMLSGAAFAQATDATSGGTVNPDASGPTATTGNPNCAVAGTNCYDSTKSNGSIDHIATNPPGKSFMDSIEKSAEDSSDQPDKSQQLQRPRPMVRPMVLQRHQGPISPNTALRHHTPPG